MIKRKIFLLLAIFFCCSLTTNLFAQKSMFNVDTLNFEYEGSLQEHHKLVVRNISKISVCVQGNLRVFDNRQRKFYEYPLVKSFLKRISFLVDEKLKLSTYSTKGYSKDNNGNSHVEYRLHKGLTTFYNYSDETTGQYIAENYMEAIIFFVCNFEYLDNSISNVVNNLKDEQFSKLVSEASTNGIKQVSTVNGFYNRELALKLSKAILFNKIQNLIKSNQEMAYRIVYVADYYIAFLKLNYDRNNLSSENEKVQNRVLDIMLKKYV